MRSLIYFLIILGVAFSAYSKEINLTEKEALCMGFKWVATQNMGVELFVPSDIDGFIADRYIADLKLVEETVFIIGSQINTSTPSRGIKIDTLYSSRFGGDVNISIHYKSVKGSQIRIYKLPPVSKLMSYDFEEC